jgi:hypothetical protein
MGSSTIFLILIGIGIILIGLIVTALNGTRLGRLGHVGLGVTHAGSPSRSAG